MILPQVGHVSNLNVFHDEQDAIKVNNLIAAHWLNIFLQMWWCLKWRNCYQHKVNVTHAVAYMHFHLPEVIDPENWPANSQYLSPVDFSVWGALQQTLYH